MNETPTRNLDMDSAVAEVEARYVAANPKSLARYEGALQTMPGGNTRTALHYDPFPVALVRGEAASVFDMDGHAYRDFLGEFTAGLYGHSEPAILEAIRGALEDGLSLGGPNRYEARLAELFCARFPALEMVRFCNSGTEANLMCLCLARAVTGRQAIMAFDGGYHGGLLAFAGGGSPINAPFRTVIGQYNDAEAAKRLIAEHAKDLAAVIVEPMMGSGGCIPADPEFLQALRQETEKHGVVLVFDEVMTSRLAPGGMQERTGVMPDLAAFGKYLGGGVSFGAFGGRGELMRRLDQRRDDGLSHSGTFNNNVLSMAAGVAGLEKVFTPEAVERLNADGDHLRAGLQAAIDAGGAPMQITGLGSMLCFHHQRRPIRRPIDWAPAPLAVRKLLHLEMNLRGFYFARRGFIALSLPLTQADHAAFVAAFQEFLEDYADVLAEAADA